MSNKLNFNISNSLISAYLDYVAGRYCGGRFEAVYINKTHIDTYGEAANAGQWFEYKVNGARLRDGSIPMPKVTKSGKLTALYEKLNLQVNNFNDLYKNIEVLEVSKILNIPLSGFNIKMILDMYVKVDGVESIRDIKTTGLLNNKWEFYGWGGDLRTKKHISQAKMYIWGIWKKTNEIKDFYFDVFSSTNSKEYKVFKVTMSLDSIKEFEKDLINISEQIQLQSSMGFKNKPSQDNCDGCPLFKECKDSTTLPDVIDVIIA